jgi:hypothetical protein
MFCLILITISKYNNEMQKVELTIIIRENACLRNLNKGR